MAGGQPCSLENIRATCELCHRHGITVFLDATRAVENCYFIQRARAGLRADRSLADILREICSYTDGCTVSAKKDCLVNIGGFLAVNDDELAEEARNLCVVYEGLHTYGGLAGRDLEAMAIGIGESVGHDHMHARIGQVRAPRSACCSRRACPIVRPIGGHGIFLNAAKFLPHMPREHFRAQALTAALYVDSGVRAMERGAVSAGRDPETGGTLPALELVRLTIPRRVYTQAHMDVVAESVISLYEERENIVGLRFTHEPKRLRFFQARFEPVEGTEVLRTAARQSIAGSAV